MGFETRVDQRQCARLQLIMRYPYGIWNLNTIWIIFIITSLWDIPMGFETISWNRKKGNNRKLWDIPMGFETLISLCADRPFLGLWDIPMGFETFMLFLVCPEVVLWDIPMGFETFPVTRFPVIIKIMRYPYGIWNNTFASSEESISDNYEISLWDLKLRGCSLFGENIILWDIPMGFETKRQM